MMKDNDPTIDLKDMAFKEELAFQLKLRPDGDRRMIEAQTREKIYGPKKFKAGKKVKRKLPKTPIKAQRARGPEAGMMGFGVAQPEGIARRVRPGLASGVRGTPKNPVGGPETVGMLERLTGKARKKAPKRMRNIEKGLNTVSGYGGGGKVRGTGIARKGTRACKMR